MKTPVAITLQHLAPQILLTRLAGWLAQNRTIWLKNALIKYFLSRHPVDLSETKISDPLAYENFHSFFTRELKSDARTIDPRANVFCSPVDGIISQFGTINQQNLVQAKGHTYTLPALLGKYDKVCERFDGGQYSTIYLSPKHYHRVHMPIDGKLLACRYIPGRLFSLNQQTSEHVPELFCQNERAVLLFKTDMGMIAIIFVGAMLVGNIVTRFTGSLSINRTHNEPLFLEYPDTPKHRIHVKKGDDIGHFTMGSTVIILSEQQNAHWANLSTGQECQMGQALFEI